MLDLLKKNIHMNRQKGNVATQLTLDDDFIVPDTMDDVEQIILATGEVQVESSKNQGDRVIVRGNLAFQILYRREGGGLQTLAGRIPFEESINVPELDEKDYVQIFWNLEDLTRHYQFPQAEYPGGHHAGGEGGRPLRRGGGRGCGCRRAAGGNSAKE